jgi:hypothetical protein
MNTSTTAKGMRLATELSLTRTATLRGLAACVLCNAVAWPQAALSLDQAILTDGSRRHRAAECAVRRQARAMTWMCLRPTLAAEMAGSSASSAERPAFTPPSSPR